MNNIIFIFFRRMRQPLLILVATYSIAALGLVLIPGQDADGHVWHMGFFHAFYFVSYMATTIGFGEIPYAFTDAQRLWVIFFIYATVIVWFYAIGTLLALVQDRAFQQALTESRFAKRIKDLKEPFFIVCGYGETGSVLVDALTENNQNVVVIDKDPDRVSLLELEVLRQAVPSLLGDASKPVHLLEAGLEHYLCQGVIAVTDNNQVNLRIAVASKLLSPNIKVICRADSHDIEDNMSSFGTDYIIDPFDTFATYLATAIQSPAHYLLNQWLTGKRSKPLDTPIYPPQNGHWVVCGYGRFGKTVFKQLTDNGLRAIIIEAAPEETGIEEVGIADKDWIHGRGTEAETLQQADIGNAVGLVAGTDNDANNLSIIMTAKELNSNLFVVARNNMVDNERLFEQISAEIVMHPSSIIAHKIQVILATPLLYDFLDLAANKNKEWASNMVKRIALTVYDYVPDVWEIKINKKQANAVNRAVKEGLEVTTTDLICDSYQREQSLSVVPLLLSRDGKAILLSEEAVKIKQGDCLLMCGQSSARSKMQWTLQNEYALDYVRTGQTRTQSWVLKHFFKDRLQ